jgi:hypothetical protein
MTLRPARDRRHHQPLEKRRFGRHAISVFAVLFYGAYMAEATADGVSCIFMFSRSR